jgi:hypothetical protein
LIDHDHLGGGGCYFWGSLNGIYLIVNICRLKAGVLINVHEIFNIFLKFERIVGLNGREVVL